MKQRRDGVYAFLFFLLTGGVGWATTEIMDHSTRLAVEESTTEAMKDNLKEIKADIKELLKR